MKATSRVSLEWLDQRSPPPPIRLNPTNLAGVGLQEKQTWGPKTPARTDISEHRSSDQADDFPSDPEGSQQENHETCQRGMAPQLYAADGRRRVRQVGQRLQELVDLAGRQHLPVRDAGNLC